MRTRVVAGLAAALVATALAALLVSIAREAPPPPRMAEPPRPARASEPRLYCQFYNFVGRTPKVGFYFAAPLGGGAEYGQISQREADGTQVEFSERPAWIYDRTGEAPALRSPDGAIQINLYGDAPARPGNEWFEAGLRSIQYLNLDGQCRRSLS